MNLSFLVVNNLCDLTLQCDGFDDLTLTGDTVDQWGNEFSIEACDDNTTWGTPVPVDVSVQRWMSDGAVASTQGFENREISFQVLVSATTTRELNAAEASLALREARPCSLVWTSPEGDDLAPASVFDVWTWHFDHEFDGMGERRLQRLYTVTMTAKPNARDQDLTTVTAVVAPGSPTTVQIDDCTSVTGWAGSSTPTTSGGAVKVTSAFTHGLTTSDLIRTGSVTLSGSPYLMLTMSTSGGTTQNWYVTVDGKLCTKVGQIGPVSIWQVPAGVTSFSILLVKVDIYSKVNTTRVLSMADVSRTDTIGGIGSRKQLTRSLRVGGSVKTSGSIRVASPDATPLGVVLLCTAPDNGMGYNPSLRQYRTSGIGTPTADVTAVSGFRETLIIGGLPQGTIQSTIPNNVIPEGTYVIAARCFSTAVTTATLSASVATGSVLIPAAFGGKITWATANTYAWGILGTVTAPAASLPPESAVPTVINMAGIGGTGTVSLDEVYLINVSTGAFSLIDCGAQTRLWIDSPDASDDNLPAVYTGTQADRSDASTPPYTQIIAVGDHDLDPRGTVLFSVTDKVNNASVSAAFYRRGHTHMPAA